MMIFFKVILPVSADIEQLPGHRSRSTQIWRGKFRKIAAFSAPDYLPAQVQHDIRTKYRRDSTNP